MQWQLQQAKQGLSELVRRALEDGPQIVTRHGRDAVVVMAVGEYERLKGGAPDFKDFLRSAPDLERLRITRDRKRTRSIKL
jgi:prevent-host-death family protein